MRLAVIGGAGFLGRSLIARLSAAKDPSSVVCLDRVAFPESAARPADFTQLVAGTDDSSLLRRAVAGADAVWIRAGILGGPQSVRAQTCADYLRENTDMVVAVLQACDEAGCRRVLFDSSGQVFGDEFDPAANTAAAEPVCRNFYGASKLIAEKLLRSWAFADGAASARSAQVFRYSRVRSFDSRDPIFHMSTAALNGKPIRVIGDPGHAIDFVHVSDVMAANLAALGRAPRFAIYHVSSGRPVSLDELAKRVQELAMAASGSKAAIERVAAEPALPFEPRVVGITWEASSRELGLPAPKPLEYMIGETLTWMRETSGAAPAKG